MTTKPLDRDIETAAKETSTTQEPENHLQSVLDKIGSRLDSLENQIEAMDRILTATLPDGSRIIPVKFGDKEVDVLYVPYMKK